MKLVDLPLECAVDQAFRQAMTAVDQLVPEEDFERSLEMLIELLKGARRRPRYKRSANDPC